MRRMIAAIALLVLAMLAGGPATAAGAAPQIVDGCGVDGVAAEPTAGATTPWTDICSGVFETLPGGSGLKITATFAGDIPDDRIGVYTVGWRLGDCTYRGSHDAGMGSYGSNGVFVSDPGGDFLRVRCGDSVPGDCSPPVSTISTCPVWPNEKHYELVDAVTVDGSTVTWTLRFSDGLADLAGRFSPGTHLTNLGLGAATKTVVAGMHPGYCYGTQCGGVGGDTASGAGYTVGD